MGSKAYRGKTCAYCAKPASSTTGDHVVARGFFLPEHRNDLPKVPACDHCNNEKSALEHYLTTILPFGGRHAAASGNLKMVEPRLAKNHALANVLSQGRRLRAVSRNGSPWSYEMEIPFDGAKADALYRLIAKGLAYLHWQVELSDDKCMTWAAHIVEKVGPKFDELFAKNGRAHVSNSLGAETFVYEGVQAVDNPCLTLWKMSFYGGVVGKASGASNQTALVYAFTGPKGMRALEEMAQLMGMPV